ncbi:MAG: 16S rRNA (cytidine(1402)-2'-O)-methyltransferase [Alphaproteobacteria bacterium RIFCSPHIGHO2_12_FULL_63_12]|nr:MAG: 16S rRNA (cytidine(1402)-2'-O)-methyltransferase [Alphaproteobacteria bacterium RIFCSPHIGHO2_12_FULL_63_12]
MTLEPGLYVAATPIGNLKDVTYRVIEALMAADRILCEDTRQTAKLCAAYAIKTPRAAYNEHNADKAQPEIIRALEAGAAICLVSDAGTPLISDPGYRLVRAARDAGVKVIPLPGPSAAITALSASGAPTEKFLFAGFPPPKAEARRAFFKTLAACEATLVFHEGPSRLGDSLAAMAEAFGDRRAVVARELTKLHEEFDEGTLLSLTAKYSAAAPKGEIVVLVYPPVAAPEATPADIDSFLAAALASMSVKDAAAAAADALGVSKKDAYARALALKGGK